MDHAYPCLGAGMQGGFSFQMLPNAPHVGPTLAAQSDGYRPPAVEAWGRERSMDHQVPIVVYEYIDWDFRFKA